MRRNTLLFILAFLGLVLQSVFVRPPLVICNVTALFVMYLALERAVLPGAMMAMSLGYLSDVVLGTDRGLYMFTLCMVFAIIRFLVARFQGGRGLFISLISILAALLTAFLSHWLESLVGLGKSTFSFFSLSSVAIITSSAALGYPLFRVLKVLDERFHEPEDDFVFKE